MDKDSQGSEDDNFPDELEQLEISQRPVSPPESDESSDDSSVADNPNTIKVKRSADMEEDDDEDDKYEPCYTKDQLDAINKFYQLKGKYDEVVRRKKQKIINNDSLSKREKKRLWDSEKIKCINCKKPVGTFFSVKGRKLLAQCGAVFSKNLNDPNIKPCKLNIDIQLASVTTMQDTIKQFGEYKEQDKEEIIKTKLNLLFNFTSEEEAIREFENKREEFDEDVNTYNKYLELFVDVHNSVEKRERIRDLLKQKEELINEIKDILKSKKDNSEEDLPSIEEDFVLSKVSDAVNVQLGQLDEVLKQLRKLKYEYYEVVEDVDNPLQHRLETKEIITERSEVLIDKECEIRKFEM